MSPVLVAAIVCSTLGVGLADAARSWPRAARSATEVAEGLLTFARSRVPTGDFRVGDLENLPFADDTFDVVIAANSVQYSQDRVRALSEFARVVAPCGLIAAALFGLADQVAFAAVLNALGDALPTRPSGGGPFTLSQPGTLEDLFNQAGLTVVNTGEVESSLHLPGPGHVSARQRGCGPVQGMLTATDEDTLQAAAMQAIDPFVQADGRVVIGPNVFRYVAAPYDNAIRSPTTVRPTDVARMQSADALSHAASVSSPGAVKSRRPRQRLGASRYGAASSGSQRLQMPRKRLRECRDLVAIKGMGDVVPTCVTANGGITKKHLSRWRDRVQPPNCCVRGIRTTAARWDGTCRGCTWQSRRHVGGGSRTGQGYFPACSLAFTLATHWPWFLKPKDS